MNVVKLTIDLNKLSKQSAVCVGSICTSHNEILKLSFEQQLACVCAFVTLKMIIWFVCWLESCDNVTAIWIRDSS